MSYDDTVFLVLFQDGSITTVYNRPNQGDYQAGSRAFQVAYHLNVLELCELADCAWSLAAAPFHISDNIREIWK